MLRAMTGLLGIALCSVFGLMAASAASTASAPDQNAVGAQLYEEKCAVCHGAGLEGMAGPPLAGRTFLSKWAGNSADDLHYIIATQMPVGEPNSLKPEEYLAVTGFILNKNQIPEAARPVMEESLKTIRFQKP